MFGILGQRFRDTQRKPALGAQLIPGHPRNSGLVSRFVLNEGGGVPIDNNALNTVTLSGPTWSQGIDGPALSFAGTYANTSLNGFPSGSAPRSVQCRFRKTSTSLDVLFGYGAATVGQMFGCYINNLRINFWGWNASDIDTGIDIVSARWHDLILTYDGATVVLFLDGVQRWSSSSSLNTGLTASQLGALTIGAASNQFTGAISEFRVWARAIAANEAGGITATPYSDLWSPSSTLYSFPAGATPSGFKPWFANATKLAA